MTIEEIFKAGNGTLTFEQFTEITEKNKVKLADINGYIPKEKYDADINELNGKISARDTDLTNIREQLEKANADGEALDKLKTELETLQGRYSDEKQAYESKLQKQAYEFAVKEYANGKKFSSNAAKRDFVNTMISKELKMDGGKILGADDFTTAYSSENADAFVIDSGKPQPRFATDTNNSQPTPTSGFNFHFTGVRQKN